MINVYAVNPSCMSDNELKIWFHIEPSAPRSGDRFRLNRQCELLAGRERYVNELYNQASWSNLIQQFQM